MGKSKLKPEMNIRQKVVDGFIDQRLAYNKAKEKKDKAKEALDSEVKKFLGKERWPIPPTSFRAVGTTDNLIISITSTYRPIKEDKLMEARKGNSMWKRMKRFFKKSRKIEISFFLDSISDPESFESELRELLDKWGLGYASESMNVSDIYTVDPELHKERFKKLDEAENSELNKLAPLEIRASVEAKVTE